MSELHFTKKHGCGNDFIFIDCLSGEKRDLADVAKRLCNRRFGVGADQLLTIHPSAVGDFKMEIYNADGMQGWDGYALDIADEQGALVMMRTYIVKDRLYRLLVTAKNDEPSKGAAKRFLDSLRLAETRQP